MWESIHNANALVWLLLGAPTLLAAAYGCARKFPNDRVALAVLAVFGNRWFMAALIGMTAFFGGALLQSVKPFVESGDNAALGNETKGDERDEQLAAKPVLPIGPVDRCADGHSGALLSDFVENDDGDFECTACGLSGVFAENVEGVLRFLPIAEPAPFDPAEEFDIEAK